MNKRLGIGLIITVILLAAMLLPACGGTSTTTTAPTTSAPTTTAAPTTAQPTTAVPTTAKPTTAVPTTGAPTTVAPTTAAPTTTAPVAANAKTIKFSYTMPKSATIAKGWEFLASEITKRTNGRYKVETYPASTLLPVPAALEGVRKGIAQIALVALGSTPGFPLTFVTGLPQFGLYADNVDRMVAGTKAWVEFYNTPEINREFSGVKLILPLELDNQILVTKKKEVHQASDFRGMKVGGAGLIMEVVTANGGAAVTQTPTDCYMNIDKGVIDGGIVTPGQISDYHLTDVANYIYYQGFGSGFFPVLMNQDFWNGMSAEDQKAVMDSVNAAIPVLNQLNVDSHKAGMDLVKSSGRTLTVPSAAETAAWIKASDLSVNKWKKDAISAGISLATCDKIYQTWVDIMKKYNIP